MKNEINKNRKELMAKLIGLLLTDGGLSIISGKRWRIHFTSNSEPFVKVFENLIKQLFNLRIEKNYRNGAWKVQTWISKKVKDELVQYSPTYRTLSIEGETTEAKIPDFIYQNSELAKDFLRYAFTADGTVIFNIGKAKYGFRFDRCVKIYCEHPNLRKQYFELLVRIGYKPTILKDAVLLRKSENIIKFAKEISFVNEVKISGNGLWRGFAKSELLQFVANSYGLKPKSLGKTKSDIHTNLVNLILKSRSQMI
ncbi:MAG: LAGLIDADG family homing endonuclease [Candidatus Aenigmatarchaeota archaeon]